MKLLRDNMDKNMFTTVLSISVGNLINMIVDETNVKEDEAFKMLYNSMLYDFLENEETKVWTYSIPMLFDLYKEEISIGKLTLPEY